MFRLARVLCSCLALFAIAGAPSGFAEAADDYPAKAIRMMVPFTPGGPSDILARALGRHLTDAWKHPVIIENRPGGGGVLAMRATLEPPHDGYALLLHSDAFSISPAIYPDLPVDPLNDFKPIALLAKAPNIVVVGPNSPYRSLKDIVSAAAVAGKVSYASAGIGSAQHMQAAKFAALSNMVEPVHVPFRGTPELLREVMTSRVDFAFATLSNAAPLIKSGELRALAISSSQRSPLFKDVPTVAEAGFPGYDEAQWWGLFAPVNVPDAIVRKLESEARAALKTDEMQKVIENLSSTPGDAFGEDFAQIVSEGIAANKRAAREANIQAK